MNEVVSTDFEFLEMIIILCKTSSFRSIKNEYIYLDYSFIWIIIWTREILSQVLVSTFFAQNIYVNM